MGLLDGLEKLINEHGSAAILKERIALANDKYAALEKKLSDSELREKNIELENQRLRLDNEGCQKQLRALEEQLSHITSKQEWVEEAGALFKKNADGTYNQTPYCPSCQTAMVSPGRQDLFRCGKKSCGQMASFNRIHLGDVLARLPSGS